MLRGQSAAHLARVLRAERDQLYELSDGEKVWLARVERARRDAVEFALVEPVAAQEAPLRIQLLLSIVKFDRFEWCLEKATELGATEIVPVAAARSGKALVAAAAKRARRWEKILFESAQQARRLRPPALSHAAKPQVAFAGPADEIRILLSESREAPPLREVLGKIALAVVGARDRGPLQGAPGAGELPGEAGREASAQSAQLERAQAGRAQPATGRAPLQDLQDPGAEPGATEMPAPGKSQSHRSVWSFLAEGQGLDPYQERFNPREGSAQQAGGRLSGGAGREALGERAPGAGAERAPDAGAERAQPATGRAPLQRPATPEAIFRRVTSVALAIGPEGGWTEDELALARAAGFHEASLGGNILRTETAVIASLAILNYALGD